MKQINRLVIGGEDVTKYVFSQRKHIFCVLKDIFKTHTSEKSMQNVNNQDNVCFV